MITTTNCPKCQFEFSLALPALVPPRLCICACACPNTVLSWSVRSCPWTPQLESKLCAPLPLIHNHGKSRKDLMSGGGIIHVSSGVNSVPSTPSSPPSTPLSLAALLMPPPSVPSKRPPLVREPTLLPVPGTLPIPLPDLEFTMLNSTMRTLRMCGWYYQRFSWQDSAATLQKSAEGTFLVRDSSDPRFLFSLSVQTIRGPTSVRLHYVAGGFRLDALPHLVNDMPVFPCVVPLIEHYARKCAYQSQHVLVDAKSQMHSSIRLTLPRRTEVPSLQHLARLAINKTLRTDLAGKLNEIEKLPLPQTVLDYLKEYPYTL